jgi:hypothetical protein
MYAYSCAYTHKDDVLSFTIKDAWAPGWPKSQTRKVKIEGDTMTVETSPLPSASAGTEVVVTTTFKRAE